MELTPEQARTANVAEAERWIALIGGGVLAIYGVARGTRAGALFALMGGGLAYHGIRGRAPLGEGLELRRGGDEDGRNGARGRVRIEDRILVDRLVPDVYRAWRRLENLPRILRQVESVLPIDGNRYHWTMKGPIGTLEWDAEIVEDRVNERLGWRSVDPSVIPNAGSVRFHEGPGGRGTELRVSLSYQPPAGPLGALMARSFGVEPQRQLEDDLGRFKHAMESGDLQASREPSRAPLG